MSEWDRQATPGGVEGPQWVSAAEAADVAGVTPGTVRYWARNGLIVSEAVEGPAGEKTLVRLDEVLAHARGEGAARRPSTGAAAGGPTGEIVTELPARTSELAPILKSIPEIMAQLTAATDRAARAETKVEFLSAQLAEMRRRLAAAEAAAGAPASEPVAIPEEWEKLDDSAAVVAEETPAAPSRPVGEQPPGVAGWPAPPPEKLHDVPAAAVSDPGPELVDWESAAAPSSHDGAAAAEELPAAEVPATVSDTSSDLSLGDIWNQPAAPRDHAVEEAEPEGVEWHDAPGAAAEAVRARAANAPIPDGDDFYGPRRRRWFRRRR